MMVSTAAVPPSPIAWGAGLQRDLANINTYARTWSFSPGTKVMKRTFLSAWSVPALVGLLFSAACLDTARGHLFEPVLTTPQDSSATAAQNSLSSIAIDASSNIFLADTIGPVYRCTSMMGSCAVAYNTSSSQFSNINGAAVDSNSVLYLADKSAIIQCKTGALCTKVFNVSAIEPTNKNLYGITFDATYNTLYVANQYDQLGGNSYVIACPYTLATATLGTCTKIDNAPLKAVGYTTGAIASLRFYEGFLCMITSAGEFYMCMSATSCMKHSFTTTGTTTIAWSTVKPTDFVVDPSVSSVIYVSDVGNNMIWTCTATSSTAFSCTPLKAAPYPKGTSGSLTLNGFSPQYMAICSMRMLYAPDRGPNFVVGTTVADRTYGPYVWTTYLHVPHVEEAPTAKTDLSLPLGLGLGLGVGGAVVIGIAAYAFYARSALSKIPTAEKAEPEFSTEIVSTSA